jgi:hypothetical protein
MMVCSAAGGPRLILCAKASRFRSYLYALSLTLGVLAGLDGRAAEIDPVTLASLPPYVKEIFDKAAEARSHAISTHINPYYLQGDFNGDGQLDSAILVVEKRTGKKGVAIIHSGSRRLHLFGAGRDWGNGSDDFPGLNAWYVYRRGEVAQGATDKPPPRLVGSALMLIKTESASALLYWDGKRYRWYQQGD